MSGLVSVSERQDVPRRLFVSGNVSVVVREVQYHLLGYGHTVWEVPATCNRAINVSTGIRYEVSLWNEVSQGHRRIRNGEVPYPFHRDTEWGHRLIREEEGMRTPTV